MKTKRTPKKPSRRPITIICAFGVITKERFDALPDQVKDRIGRAVYGCFMRLAEKEGSGEGSLKMAA